MSLKNIHILMKKTVKKCKFVKCKIFDVFYFCLFYYSCPNFPPLPFSVQSPHPAHSCSLSPHSCQCPWSSIHVLWLIPSPSFHNSPQPPFSSSGCRYGPCFHVSDSVLLVSLFCSLDSSYKWDHMIFVFHGLAYFTRHKNVQFHPCCHKG